MKLTVENFQIHQKPKTVEIPEGQTTYLEGDSDTGKSAMLRAIRWLCENKPDGGSFVTFKTPRGTNARVLLEVDGRLVMRERGKSTNLYKLDGETFEAFGRSVPEPVQRALRLSPYAFQLQGEPSFLIGASPTEAAKMLSEACGLGVIDTAVGCVRAKKTVVEAEIRKGEILLESAQRRLADAEKFLPAAEALEKAAGAGEEVERLDKRRRTLSDAIDAAPAGEALDIAAARQKASEAGAADLAAKELSAKVAAMRQACYAAPVGEVMDLTAAMTEAGEARLLAAWLSNVSCSLSEMRALLAVEPKGVSIDTSAASSALARAKALDTERGPLSETVRVLRGAIGDEPRGGLKELTSAREALKRALALEKEQAELDRLCASARAMLRAEPVGTMLDTSELLKQRERIKVCPTCGREL